jgi:pilus assembly protein Flp/PilA
MKRLYDGLRRFVASDEGATAVEYAVMVALIIVAALAAVQALGTNVTGTFQAAADAIGGS